MDTKAELIKSARAIRSNAYAPYSVYQVGASALGSNGRIYSGCNVENVSFGLCICAERSAISAMVSDGCTELVAMAVSTADGGTPCGMCRQVMLEFAMSSSVPVWCTDEAGLIVENTVGELIPFGFQSPLKKI